MIIIFILNTSFHIDSNKIIIIASCSFSYYYHGIFIIMIHFIDCGIIVSHSFISSILSSMTLSNFVIVIISLTLLLSYYSLRILFSNCLEYCLLHIKTLLCSISHLLVSSSMNIYMSIAQISISSFFTIIKLVLPYACFYTISLTIESSIIWCFLILNSLYLFILIFSHPIIQVAQCYFIG